MRPGAIVDGGRLRSGLMPAILVGVWAAGCLATPQQAQAQMQSIPTDTYFAAINNLYDQGEYVQALKQFQAEWQHGAVKAPSSPNGSTPSATTP